MDGWKFWAAFGVGVAAGAAVALLYAPQSGERTRKQVRRKLEDAADYVRDAADTISEHAGSAYKTSREAVEDAIDSAGNVYNVAAKRVQNIL